MQSTESSHQECEQSINPDRIKMITEMFEDWKRVYQSRFDPTTYDLRTAELWAMVIKRSGISLSQFEFAYKKSLIPAEVGQKGFPPSSADDFINLAIIYEYMDADAAFLHACDQAGKLPEEHKWFDCVVYEAARRCDIYRLKNCTHGYGNTFKKIYEKVVAEHKAGQTWDIPEPRPAIENVHIPASDEHAQNCLDEIKREINMKGVRA